MVELNPPINRSEISLTMFAESQHGFGSNGCRWPTAGQSHALSPSRTVAVSRAGQKRDPLRQTFFLVFQKHNEPLGQRCNVASATRSRQTGQAARAPHFGRVQIAETIHFRRAQKTEMHPPGLEQAHDAHHVQALRGAQEIRRIGHGVNQLRRRSAANYTVLKQANRVWSMSFFRDHECNERKPHADKDQFAIADLACGSADHEFAHGIFRCRAMLGWTAEGGCPYLTGGGLGWSKTRPYVVCSCHRLMADFRGSAMVSNGSRAPSFSAIHFFWLAMISSSNFLSSAVGR